MEGINLNVGDNKRRAQKTEFFYDDVAGRSSKMCLRHVKFSKKFGEFLVPLRGMKF